MSNGKGRTAAQRAEHNKAVGKKADADADVKAGHVANLIGPPGRLMKACRADAFKVIWSIQDHSDILNGIDIEHTIETKRSLRRFAKAVADLEYVWNSTPLFPFDVRPSIDASMEEVLVFGRYCDEVASAPGKGAINKEATKRHYAVKCAYELMKKYAPDKIVGTEGSKFCRVAELLCGGEDPNLRLTSQCKSHIRAVRKVEKDEKRKR